MAGIDVGIGTALGMGIDLLSTDWKYRKQYEQQKKLQQLQMAGQKEMAQFNTALQKETALDMWNKTNVEAQRKHIENAGLNVGLMYGMGGGGGATTSTPTGNVTGGTATQQSTGMGIATGMALQKQQAEIENIKAVTSLTKAQEEKLSGADTDKTIHEIKKLVQDTNNAILQAIS